MTGQNDRQDRSLTGQVHDQAGHCPLTGRYLQPCCAVKNNLGILVVVFIRKCTRFELLFIRCGGHFRKQMFSICMCFQDYYYARCRKNVSSVAVLTRDLKLPRSNRKREYAAQTVRLIVSYCSNGKR